MSNTHRNVCDKCKNAFEKSQNSIENFKHFIKLRGQKKTAEKVPK